MSVSKYWREMPHRYRLEANQCRNCQNIFFPKRIVCADCGGREFQPVTLTGNGKLISYTVIHVAPSGFTDQAPYAVGIVELQEGVRLLAQIADCPLSELKTGMPVKIKFRRISEDGEAGILHYGYKGVPV